MLELRHEPYESNEENKTKQYFVQIDRETDISLESRDKDITHKELIEFAMSFRQSCKGFFKLKCVITIIGKQRADEIYVKPARLWYDHVMEELDRYNNERLRYEKMFDKFTRDEQRKNDAVSRKIAEARLREDIRKEEIANGS